MPMPMSLPRFDLSMFQLIVSLVIVILSVVFVILRRRQRQQLQPAQVQLPAELRQRIQVFRAHGRGLRNFRAAVKKVMKLLALRRSWNATGVYLNQPHVKSLTEHLKRVTGRIQHTGVVQVRDVPVRPNERVSFARVSRWTPIGLRF